MALSHSFTAVIAAAGLSSRMGSFKPVLPLEGESICRRLILSFLDAGSLPPVVVTGFKAQVLAEHLSSVPVRLVYNAAFQSSEMFDSLSIGLSFLLDQGPSLPDKIFLCPGDIPLIMPRTISLMACQDAGVVIPSFEGRRGHPVCVDASLIPRILSHGGKDGLRGALKAIKADPLLLPVSDPGILMDADTKQDYQRLKTACRKEQP